MSDDELAKIFDVGDHEEGATADPLGDQFPCSSSKCADDDDDLMAGDATYPADPVASATGDGAAMKRKPGEATGATGSKRVRIETPPADDGIEVVDQLVAMGYCGDAGMQVVDQLVAMGYDRNKVMYLRMTLGLPDLNQMLDALMQQEENGQSMMLERGQNTSPCPFGESIEPCDDDLLEHIESIDTEQLLQSSSSQKPSPSFVDLCDEMTLRRYLHGKYPPTEDSREFVVRTAAMMAQRLKQVNYVSRVARLAKDMFIPTCELYSHYLSRLPCEPESGIIDRAGIRRENDAPYGLLIDVAEAFVNNNGLDNIAYRIRDETMDIKDIGHLCSILTNLSWMTFPGRLDELMGEAADRMREMMADYSDKEIRDERTRRDILEASRKVCKGMTPGASTSPRYEFIERLMLCGNMDAKKHAIDELVKICDSHTDEDASVRKWMKRRNILSVLLADHLDHVEYVSKITPILRKLAPVLSEREFRMVWCLQKGRGGISNDIFAVILANLAAGFQADQIVMLFKYFGKQMAQMAGCNARHLAFMRITDIVLTALTRAPPRPPIDADDRCLFIESFMRLLNRFLETTPTLVGFPFMHAHYVDKIANMYRGLPPANISYAISRLAMEMNRMKETDKRFPLYFSLVHHIVLHLKCDMPIDYHGIGPLLAHHRFAEKSTQMLIAMARQTVGEFERLDQLARAQDEMSRARAALLLRRQQQLQNGAQPDDEPEPADGAAGGAAAAAAPTTAAAADAPPPSAVTPISNGPSPKRDGSPSASGSGAQESSEAPTTSSSASEGMEVVADDAAPAAAAAEMEKEEQEEAEEKKENGVKEETVSSVCTPPCTPEPLRVSTSRLGSKEWEKEFAELQQRVTETAPNVCLRLITFSHLMMEWHNTTLIEDPIPGCELLTLPDAVIGDMFCVIVDAAKGGYHKRLITASPFWGMAPYANNISTVIRSMLRAVERKQPVFRAFLTKLCTMPPDFVSVTYVETVRAVVDTCCKSPHFDRTSAWLEEILRFMWRLAVCRTSDVRDRAVEVLKMILCERYRTFKLVTVFAVARFNEALDNFNRFSGRDPIPHWVVKDDDEEDGEVELILEDKDGKDDDKEDEDEIDVDKENEEERDEKMEEEKAVDLSLAPREKRARSSDSISEDVVRAMLGEMRMQAEVKSREEAEFQLSRTISFVRRIVAYGYLEGDCDFSLVVRERAIPGEVCDLTMRVFGPVSVNTIQISFPTNEPLCSFADRVKKLLPIAPPVFGMHWPAGFKVRHYTNAIHWEKHWCSVGEQLGLNSRGGPEDCQVMMHASPFNCDFETEGSIRREQGLEPHRPTILEEPLGHVITRTNLVPLLHQLVAGVTSTSVQDTILHLTQQLPLAEVRSDAEIAEICCGALQLRKPHQALYHLISLLGLLLPPNMTVDNGRRARRVFEYVRKTGFVAKFMAMMREIDYISECLSNENLTLFHEVCLTLIRLFYLRQTAKHRAYVRNFKRNEKRKEGARAQAEVEPIDTQCIGESLSEDEVPQLLRTMFQFIWAAVAPRRIDVERELSIIVPSATVRIGLAKEKRVDNSLTYRRSMLARQAIIVMLDIAQTHGDKDKNWNALFNPDSIDGVTVAFWRDMLMNLGAIEIQQETRMQLYNLIDTEDQRVKLKKEMPTLPSVADARPTVRKLLLRLVFELGRGIWGPTAALEYCASGRNPVELLRLAERVIKLSRKEEMQDEALDSMIDEWVGLQTGFMSEQRPPWNARCHMTFHVGILQELLKKIDGSAALKVIRGNIKQLLQQALFPFATCSEGMEERYGRLPALQPIGIGLAEGEVRKKYLEIITYYAEQHSSNVLELLLFLSTEVHARAALNRWCIQWWDKAEKMRRQRTESFCGPQLNLAQRLHTSLTLLRDMDVRLVKGLLNPSYMCYANSVLQQLIFIPGVCEGLFALGDFEDDLRHLKGGELRDGCLLRQLQGLFAGMLFSAEPACTADHVLGNIDLPSGGSVREQQDCVEFLLTLIDKCDTAAEKMNRLPVFKRFLAGVMGYEYACKTCKHRHRGVDEAFTALNLEIHGNTVGESLDHFMDGALLEGASAAMCEQCGEKRTTLRIGALRSAPTTLCIQLKRFSTFDSNGGKLNIKVEVPRELDLTRFSEAVRTATDEQVDKMFGWFDDSQDEPVVFAAPPDCAVRWRYRLVGVIVHSGQLGNGHYTSYVKERRSFMRDRPWFDHWLLANDDRVTVQDDKLQMEWQGSGEENTPSAYLLWYEMIADDEAAMIRELAGAGPANGTGAGGPQTPAAAENGIEEHDDSSFEDTVEVPEEDLLIPDECLAAMDEECAAAPDDDSMAARDRRAAASSGDCVAAPAAAEALVPLAQLAQQLQYQAQYRRQYELLQRAKDESEWMDVGLGSLGVLEGPRLDLYKCMPPGIRANVYRENLMFQLGRDVLTESYAKFLLHLLRVALEHTKYQEADERHKALSKILMVARVFLTDVLWRTREYHAHESDKVLSEYRFFVDSILKEHTDFCTEWLVAFYDPAAQAISHEWRAFLIQQDSLRNGIGQWFWLASAAIGSLRDAQPTMVEAYCCQMVECLRLALFRLDGFCYFFIQTVHNPHCVDYYVKHSLLQAICSCMFYYQTKNMTWGLQAEFTLRKNLPICTHLVQLFQRAIGTNFMGEDEFKDFVETRLHLLMAPIVRNGEDYILKLMNLMLTTMRQWEDESWIGRFAQSILMCLKVDPYRANGIFYLITAVGKSLSIDRASDFYDEILGKRENDAAENGLIIPGVIIMLENMLAEHKEHKQIAQIENALVFTMSKWEAFRECAAAYQDRINGIQIRSAEWKEQEAAETEAMSAVNAQRQGMLIDAEDMAMLPLDACGPIARPAGCSMNGRAEQEYEMMNVSDDEMDDEEDEMLSEDEDFSDNEAVNLTNHQRR